MEPTEGARAFQASGDAYDAFMGRYSRALAVAFAGTAGVRPGQSALDVGCGPGALTDVLVERLGAAAVAGVEPSEPFMAACTARHPDVDVRHGRAEAIPFGDATFDVVLAQLVLHFVTDPERAALEMSRVARPGGIVGACVWAFDGGMEMLDLFWESALSIDPDAPDEARTMRFGREGEIAALFDHAGLLDARETVLRVTTTYADFDELWQGFCHGIGPAGAYCTSLDEPARQAVREALRERVPAAGGTITLAAAARCGIARRPA